MTDARSSATGSSDWAATILRLSLGGLFIAHGWLKLFVFTPAGTYGYFEKLGMPGVMGYATMAAEFTIGAALILGIATRWVALAGIPLLLGAIAVVHGPNGFWAGKNGWEYIGLWIAAQAALALLGDGKLALGKLFSSSHGAGSPPVHA
jgi:putative oxidoreductase